MIINHRPTIRSFDYISFFLMILLSAIGLVFIFSATYTHEKPLSYYCAKQLAGICGGIIIYFICLIPDFRTTVRLGHVAYFAVIALLLFTLIKGSMGMGAKRWLNLLFFKLQPSELAKFFFPANLAHYLQAQKKTILHTSTIFTPVLVILGISFLLIKKQPDLGTALIILLSGLILCWLAGLSKNFFLYGLVVVMCLAPLIWQTALRDYQKNRIVVFFGHGNQQKERYQIEQASIAIGSGGIWGKGLFNGTQNRLLFLPESRTDFIFAVLCEECGLMGALVILLCYATLFLRAFSLIKNIQDEYAQLFASGLILHILLSTLINIGMVIGIVPIVGIPLPLMSYGLSNLWITFASLGLFQNMMIRCR